MPIWAVALYDEDLDFTPNRRGVVKAHTQGEAYVIVKGVMGNAKRADLIPQVVLDESAFSDGYTELPTN